MSVRGVGVPDAADSMVMLISSWDVVAPSWGRGITLGPTSWARLAGDLSAVPKTRSQPGQRVLELIGGVDAEPFVDRPDDRGDRAGGHEVRHRDLVGHQA